MMKSEGMTKPELRNRLSHNCRPFNIRASDFFRDSTFGFRHSAFVQHRDSRQTSEGRVWWQTGLAAPTGSVISTAVMFKSLIDWYLNSLDTGGYPLVVLLMAIESSILPLPSELVIPPAAHLAYTKGNLSITGIIIAGTIGSWIGATAMYWASRLAGRPLIGIPAGIVRMDYKLFSLFTLLGSAVWCAVLCWVGVKAGQDEALMKGELHRVSLWVIGALAVLGGIYYLFVHRHMKADSKQ